VTVDAWIENGTQVSVGPVWVVITASGPQELAIAQPHLLLGTQTGWAIQGETPPNIRADGFGWRGRWRLQLVPPTENLLENPTSALPGPTAPGTQSRSQASSTPTTTPPTDLALPPLGIYLADGQIFQAPPLHLTINPEAPQNETILLPHQLPSAGFPWFTLLFGCLIIAILVGLWFFFRPQPVTSATEQARQRLIMLLQQPTPVNDHQLFAALRHWLGTLAGVTLQGYPSAELLLRLEKVLNAEQLKQVQAICALGDSRWPDQTLTQLHPHVRQQVDQALQQLVALPSVEAAR
jgi:hypothetical protein